MREPETYARVYAEIDLDAVLDNVEQMKANIAKECQIMGVIKADGYGHGSVALARELEPLSCLFGFATATFEEAMALRDSGVKKPILILGYTFPYCYETLAAQEIRPAVFREDMVREMSYRAERAGKPVKIHIKTDTGMSRIGIRPDDSGLRFVETCMGLPGLEIEGIFTHFAKADMKDKENTRRQIRVFQAFTEKIQSRLGLSIPIKHCSNSAGIIRFPTANMDMVRAGITLYGLWPSDEVERDVLSLRPAMSLKSHIVYIKEMAGNEEISYGGTFTARAGMKVATVPVGYGDGYPRSLSGKGYVLICGKKAPVVGRVCMDQMMVDVTKIKEAKEGDLVTLLGEDGEERLTAEMLGEMSGRFNYELVCDINQRVPRIYKKHNRIVGTKDYYHNFAYLPEKGQ